MSEEEAQKVAAIMGFADGGCSHCVRELCDEANKMNLGWRFEMGCNAVMPEDEFGICRHYVTIGVFADPPGTEQKQEKSS